MSLSFIRINWTINFLEGQYSSVYIYMLLMYVSQNHQV